MNSVVCEGNNENNEKNTENTNNEKNAENAKKGGCFRLKNVFYREIVNITVRSCFSSQTTAGLKIIDENLEDFLKELGVFLISDEKPYVFF